MYKYTKQIGIGLLELMLAMAIISILIVMSISYFQSSKNKTLLSAGVEEIQDFIGVLSGLSSPKNSADNGDLTVAVSLSGSIPKQYIESSDKKKLYSPWGEKATYTIAYGTVKGGPAATINGSGLPNYACQSLATQFDGAIGILSSDCKNLKKGTLKIVVDLARGQGIIIP